MRLSSATVYGLFGLFDHSININTDGVTFIHSVNGIGKSVFLKLIFDVLRADVDSIKSTRFDRIDISFDDGSNLIVEKGDNLLIQMQKNELEEELSLEDLEDLKNPVYISPERLTLKKKDGRLMYALNVYAEELEDLFLAAKEDAAIDVKNCNNINDLSDEEIEYRLKELKTKTDYMCNSGLRINLPVGIRLPPTRFDISKNHENYLKLVADMEEYVSNNYTIAESIVVFQDIINMFMVNKSFRINNGKMTVLAQDGINLSLDTLSSGEKHLLVMFYKLLFQTEKGSVVLIDEPEISLHVSWQQKIGAVLTDICRLRDLQVLVATHSPQIIHDMWDLANELRSERA